MFIKIRLEGISPLLMHRFTDEDQMSATNGSRVSSAAKDRGTPKEQAEKSLYLTPEGELCLNQPMIMASIINGGKFFKNGKSKITTLKNSIIPAVFFLGEPYYPLITENGWEVDARPVRIPSTGGRIIRYRPIFQDWAVDLDAELDEEEINPKLMREIVDAAGKKIGIGDFRPECKGPFGRYVVTNWEIVEE